MALAGRRADLLNDRGDHGDELLGRLRRRPVFQEHAFDLEPDRRIEGTETHRGLGAGARGELVDHRHPRAAAGQRGCDVERLVRSEEHTSELQSLMRISYAVFCLKKKNKTNTRYSL